MAVKDGALISGTLEGPAKSLDFSSLVIKLLPSSGALPDLRDEPHTHR